MSRDAAIVADAMVVLLRRSTRARLQQHMFRDVHPVVDALTYPVVIGVARLGPVSAARLATELDLDRTVVSRRATALVTGGLIAKTPDTVDRRAVLLHLTDLGRAVAATLDNRRVEEIDRLLKPWTAQERAELGRYMTRFGDTLRGFTD